jgi:hypothetical protein
MRCVLTERIRTAEEMVHKSRLLLLKSRLVNIIKKETLYERIFCQ